MAVTCEGGLRRMFGCSINWIGYECRKFRDGQRAGWPDRRAAGAFPSAPNA
jgi:hypothetical protein